jgi:ubiquinol-cytochrome c reductase cytochrome b subunit
VLVQHEALEPLQLTAAKDANGVDSPVARKERIRAKVSNFYFRDRVAPPTPTELEAAHHAHEAHAEPAVAHEAIEPAGVGQERETIKADRQHD